MTHTLQLPLPPMVVPKTFYRPYSPQPSNPMAIDSLLNTDAPKPTPQPFHSRTYSVPSSYLKPSPDLSQRSWTSSPDPSSHQRSNSIISTSSTNLPPAYHNSTVRRDSADSTISASSHTSPASSWSTLHQSPASSPKLSSRASPSRERREFRPTYKEEEEHFIWYHRVDLGLEWAAVKAAFERQFPGRQRKGFQGIQCKYYRCCEANNVPKVRERNRRANPRKQYGLRAKFPNLYYPWMERAAERAVAR